MSNTVRILLLDIETSPILAYVWKIWEENVSLGQIHKDWAVLAWSAKWLDSKEIMYKDNRHAKDVEDDKNLLKDIWKLLDECDVVITQNGRSFDIKKLNARFIQHGFQPPSSFKHIDTLRLARKHFAFTSNKLEYMTKKLNNKYKKSNHAKFSGFELWKQCLLGNKEAWNEMEKYNKLDVLCLEELYKKLIPWDNSINFSVYNENNNVCSCGSTEFKKRGFFYTSTNKYQRFKCLQCGKESRDRAGLLSKGKLKYMKVPTKG